MIVYAEWICSRCSGLHRIKFNVMVSFNKPTSNLRNWKSKINNGEIQIDDLAHSKKSRRRRTPSGGGSKIYCKPMTKTKDIFKVLEIYMKEFYSLKPETLKLGVCLD